jgi:DNA-binding transcriptional LysR family regulator
MLNRKILFFISVVESGSFSSAAKQFYLSQSAISQQIMQLETELGCHLFNRSGYRPVLTEAGTYYYSECKKLVEHYDQVLINLSKLDDDKQKILKIGITGPMEKKDLPQIMTKFKNKFGDVHIDIKKINFESGSKQLLNGSLDVAFGIANDFKDKEEICSITLLKHKVCVICSKDHPWANRTSVDGREIALQPIVSFSRNMGSNFYFDFIQSFKKDGVSPHIVKEVEGLEELLLAVRFNQGIALTSREVVTNEDEVCQLDIDNTHHHAEFCIGYRKNNKSNYLNGFIEETKAFYLNENHKKNL